MRTDGQTLTCDVCGASVFLAHTGDEEADGGFTHWREYEKPPEGWNSAGVRGLGDLCPECSERIRAAVYDAIAARRDL